MATVSNPVFYAVIIGTEILNGRREDRHFDFLKKELSKRGWRFKASFLIEDDPSLIESIYTTIAEDENGVMFSFGGIGATPDDYTRAVAAKVFGDGKLYEHPKAKELILKRFGDSAYPHRINMAKLPKGTELLHNPINLVPGFYLQKRYFFVPGFPEMAHPMIIEALNLFYPKAKEKPRYTICVEASENDLMDLMQQIPKEVEFSSLPAVREGRYFDVISIAGEEAKKWIEFFIGEIEKRGYKYKWGEAC